MSEQAITDRYHVVFSVTEYSDDEHTPWIKTEPQSENLPALGNGSLGFDLRPGVDFEKAKEIAQFLNEHIEAIHHTHFVSSGDYVTAGPRSWAKNEKPI